MIKFHLGHCKFEMPVEDLQEINSSRQCGAQQKALAKKYSFG